MNNKFERLKEKSIEAVLSYEKDTIEDMTEMLNEIAKYKKLISEYRDILYRLSEYEKYIWKTADNKFIALHKIDDNHLVNIVKMLKTNGSDFERMDIFELELERRGLEISEIVLLESGEGVPVL